MRIVALAAALLLALSASLTAHAQTYPSKPIRAVVAFGTGGATDVIARIIAAALSLQLGQPVVIDNRPGADGIVAGEQVAKAPADGYTVFFATSTQISALPSMREAGMQPFPAVPWMGMFGPLKLPREIVDRLSRELAAVLQKPEVREQIERQAMDVNYQPAETLGALAREQTAVWRTLTKSAGITPE